MFAIYKREIQSFFTSPIGYMVIGLFIIFSGLFLWVFKGQFNIFDYGFADLSNFFAFAPWVFLFLIPAITMKSFSEERKTGTLELLLIKPISHYKLVLGKFLGTFTLVIIALLPTLIYVVAVSKLGTTEGNLDTGVVFGSYFGLCFLVASYTSIGLFASSLTQNQIVAFLLAIIFCFVFFYGFEGISSLFSDGNTAVTLTSMGMKSHFESIGRGVLDTRDLIYFIGLTAFFGYLTVVQLKNLNQ